MPEEKFVETPKGEIKVKVEEKKVKFDATSEVKKDLSVPDTVAETVADPFCDENNPRIITFQDVCQAAFMIKGGIDVTPCRVRNFSDSFKWNLIVKNFTALSFVRTVWDGDLFEEGVFTIYGKF